MNNPFASLGVDYEEDTSTNNLDRKLKKLKRKQLKNPTEERAAKIKELDLIINPPKYNKKDKEKDKSDDDILEEAYKKNNSYWKKQERLKKYFEQMEKQEKEERDAARKKAKEDKINNKKIRIGQNIKDTMVIPCDIIQFISIPPKKDVYRKLVLKYHPDKGGDEEYFKIINNHMN